jgi:serine protease Do/serine protease DegQ
MLSRLLVFLFFLAPSQLVAGSLPNSAKESAAPVVRGVMPGVVNIATSKNEQVEVPVVSDPLLQQFFDLPNARLKRVTTSAGSGVTVDAEQQIT